MDQPTTEALTIKLNARFAFASIVVLAVLIGILGGYLLFSRTSGTAAPPPGEQPVLVLPEGQALISGVLCPCGRCSDLLAICNCVTAGDIKRTINRLVSQNRSKAEIQETLKSKYGQLMFNYAKN